MNAAHALLAALMVLLVCGRAAFAQDNGAAVPEAAVKKANCLNCHAVETRKMGPAFKDVSAKYKGRDDAESAIYAHLTGAGRRDGKAPQHPMMKAGSETEARIIVKWVLSR